MPPYLLYHTQAKNSMKGTKFGFLHDLTVAFLTKTTFFLHVIASLNLLIEVKASFDI